MKPLIFDSIAVQVPKDKIYSRLGYSKGKTVLNQAREADTDLTITKGLEYINLKGVAVIFPIKINNLTDIRISKNIVFKSKSLVKALEGCQEILLMGATAGGKIAQAITEGSKNEDMVASVIFDATASEMVDSALSWIINYFNRKLLRENKYFAPMRFSAGYGDFILENQKQIYKLLNMEKIGTTLTKEYILLPEKSVTAIIGIKSNSN